MKESDLFNPLQKYLSGQGYEVYSEVKNCDLVATRGEEMLIVEIKMRMSLQLILQAVSRQELNDSVYVAVPLTSGRSYPANFTGIKKLLRRLGIGLIYVRLMKTKSRVEVALHPQDPRLFNIPSRKHNIIREINGRYAEFNKAGEAAKIEKITAFKQLSIRIAVELKKRESASPAQLQKAGLPAKTGRVLSQNVYGWFERVERGVYRISSAGISALERYPEVIRKIPSG